MMRLVVLALAAAVLHATAAPPPVFGAHSTLRLVLDAPLDELFASAAKDPDASVRGRLTYSDDGREVVVPDVRISVRGNTSRNSAECTFPKLKLRFETHPADDTLFAGTEAIKIGTHCGNSTSDALTRNGRLPNEKSAHREAFAYRLLATLGVPTLDARSARIEYRDTSRDIAPHPPLERDALLLEDDDQAMKRLGAARAIGEDEFTSARDALTRRNAIDIAFGEAAIGNFDWCLKFTPDDRYRCDARHPLWNVLAFERPGTPDAALIYDFDTAGIVAGRHRWFKDIFNPQFADTEAAVEVAAQIQRTRTLFSRQELDDARRRFASRRDAAYAALEAADVDADGISHARRYLEPFFAAMSDDRSFYLPVVVAPDTRFRANGPDGDEACAGGGAAPPGTPIGRPVAERDGALQAIVLDALWHWTGKNTCQALLSGPVWVAREAVSTDFPKN